MYNVDIETPLHYFHLATSGKQPYQIQITEKNLSTFVNLRADINDDALIEQLNTSLDVSLPVKQHTFSRNTDISVYWLGPDEWLIRKDIVDNTLIENLKQVLNGHYSLVDNSGGLTCISIDGVGVEDILKKSTVYDCHIDNFPVNKCVQTTFAKVSALIIRNDVNNVDLIIRRSFADYIAQWLLDASKEFGCKFFCESQNEG